MTRAQWLQRRQQGIGASEAAAVLGLSPYASPLSLFYEKTSGQQVEEDSEVQEWGLALEPLIAAKYASVTGRTVQTPEPFTVYEHPEKPFILATPDRFFSDPAICTNNETAGCLELKTSAYFKPDEELPLHWQIQVQAQLLVTGLTLGSFGILVAGRKFYHADVERNDAFIALLLERLEEFWNHVQRGIPPDADSHIATAEALRRMYPKDQGTVIQLPAPAVEWAADLATVKEQIAALEDRERGLQNNLRAALADNTWGVFPDGSGYSLKTTKREGYIVAATEYRQLRRVTAIPKGLLHA